MKLTKEKTDLLLNGTREERIYATSKSFKLFCVFYFTKYFSYQPAPFHDDFFQDFEDLVYGRIKDAAWIAYRESAKTSIAKMGPHVAHRPQAGHRRPESARRRGGSLGRAPLHQRRLLRQAERREHRL
jgi:hypothetical protein